jgi:hypothetical protein
MVAVAGGGKEPGVKVAPGVGVGGYGPGVGVAGGVGVAESAWSLASAAKLALPTGASISVEDAPVLDVEVEPSCTVAKTPPLALDDIRYNAEMLSTAMLPFADGVGSARRTVSVPSVGIGTVEPETGERMANSPAMTGTVTVVDAPCSSV